MQKYVNISIKQGITCLNIVKNKQKLADLFGKQAITCYLCTRNQVSLISRGTMARLASSRLTTSIKVQISRERRRDRTSKTSKENATQLARLQKRKRQRSL